MTGPSRRSLARALAGLALAALLVGLGTVALVLTSDHDHAKPFSATLGLFTGWSFVGAGLYAWWRRPENRVGALMATTGFAWALGALADANSDALFTIGLALGSVGFAVAAQLLLSYPSGRLEGRGPRAIVALAYVTTTLLTTLVLLFRDPGASGCGCPHSAILITRDDVAGTVLAAVAELCGQVAAVAMMVVLWRRWRAATGPRRRAVGPVLWAGFATMLVLTLMLAVELVNAPGRVQAVAAGVASVVFASVPYAFLLGLVRSRVWRGGRVSELVERLGRGRPDRAALRDALAHALGDPSLELAYWLPERGAYVDEDGREVALPAAGSPRAGTEVEREGRRVAALLHDASLCDEPELVRAAGAAAALALENARLETELRVQVEEVRASRARLISAGIAERRRLERDLHDGAQQRLVSLSIALRLARTRLESDPQAAARLLDGAGQELTQALAELRELARGIHPAVLADRGLAPALEALAGRAPLPVRLVEAPAERLPDPVEAAAYFVVAEALTNVAKYARASEATVSVARQDGRAVVEVCDDGVGGADPARGSGLRGLADRLAALDGRLRVDSRDGGGTVVRAEIPVR